MFLFYVREQHIGGKVDAIRQMQRYFHTHPNILDQFACLRILFDSCSRLRRKTGSKIQTVFHIIVISLLYHCFLRGTV